MFQAEIRRLQKELKRVTDERDILKTAAYFANCPTGGTPLSVTTPVAVVRLLCRVLDVHPSGFTPGLQPAFNNAIRQT